jgi:predicted RNase H-like HicB family nuclease
MSEPTTTATPTVRPVTIEVEVKVRLRAIALQEADGGYSVAVPSLPGCTTQGDTLDEVKANVIEAAEGWLDVSFDNEKDDAIRSMLP